MIWLFLGPPVGCVCEPRWVQCCIPVVRWSEFVSGAFICLKCQTTVSDVEQQFKFTQVCVTPSHSYPSSYPLPHSNPPLPRSTHPSHAQLTPPTLNSFLPHSTPPFRGGSRGGSVDSMEPLLRRAAFKKYYSQTYYVHYANTRATHLSFTVEITQLLPSTLNSSLPHSTLPFHTQLLPSAINSSLPHSTPPFCD